jgi:Minichromosome loss protein, Mcl1, middle region
LRQQDNPLQIHFLRQITEFESAPTDLLWLDKCDQENSTREDVDHPSVHPKQQQLLVACANGTLVTLTGNILQLASPHQLGTKKSSAIHTNPAKETLHGDSSDFQKEHSPKTKSGGDTKDIFDDSDDDENVFGDDDSNHMINTGHKAKPSSNPFIDDEAEDDENSLPATKKASSPPGSNNTKESSFRRAKLPYRDMDDAMSIDGDYPMYPQHSLSANHRSEQQMSLPDIQPPFAPSSSPLDLSRRFLCWNHIGSVTLRRTEDDVSEDVRRRNVVDIHFTDSGVRRPLSFTDTLGFILGSVGEDGGIFATDVLEDDDDDDDALLGDVIPVLSEKTRQAVKKSRRKQQDPNKPTGSTIYFHRFETFASLRDKDWYLTLPNGERALGCAAGEGWAAVITRYALRIVWLFATKLYFWF